MKTHPRRGLRFVIATLTLAGLLWMPGAAGAKANEPLPPTNPVTVNYSCFVTPGGSTFVAYSQTWAVTAPTTVGPPRKFEVVLDPPVITPNPALQTKVNDVAVAFRLPDNARLRDYELSGGSNLGPNEPTVEIVGDVLVLKAAGPFASGVPFDLPTLTLELKADPNAGVTEVLTGGTSYDRPTFMWTRTDLQGTDRPFMCQPPTPQAFSSTTVER